MKTTTKDSGIKRNALFLGNISKYVNYMKKTSLNGYIYDFFVDYNTIDTRDIADIHKYLRAKHDMLHIFGFIKIYLLRD